VIDDVRILIYETHNNNGVEVEQKYSPPKRGENPVIFVSVGRQLYCRQLYCLEAAFKIRLQSSEGVSRNATGKNAESLSKLRGLICQTCREKVAIMSRWSSVQQFGTTSLRLIDKIGGNRSISRNWTRTIQPVSLALCRVGAHDLFSLLNLAMNCETPTPLPLFSTARSILHTCNSLQLKSSLVELRSQMSKSGSNWNRGHFL
jgi:hypothetical protein